MIAVTRVLMAAAIYGWRVEVAYFADSVTKNIGALVYSGAYLLFFSVLFSQVDEFVGYSKDELLLLYLFGQLSFYIYAAFAGRVNMKLVDGVNRGGLDYHLLRPKSTLLSMWSESMSLAEFARSAPVVVFIAALIDWSVLQISLSGTVLAILTLIIGTGLLWCVQFILGCTGFWVSQSSSFVYLIYALDSQYIPLDGLKGGVRALLLYVAPLAIKSALAVAFMLGHIGYIQGLSTLIVASIWIFGLAVVVWRNGLRAYTSASS